MLGFFLVCSLLSGTIAVWFSVRLGLAVSAGDDGIRAVRAIVSLLITWAITLIALAESMPRML